MGIRPYLAMTEAEIHNARKLPERLGWMACHFSPYDRGLTNLPSSLPEGSLLTLNDRMPPCNSDPHQIAKQLRSVITEQKCAGLLLDFQRPGCNETAAIAAELVKLPCPVAVAAAYALDLDCAILLPPVPVNLTLQEYLAPYQGREIWLELALEAAQICVTSTGCSTIALFDRTGSFPFQNDPLHCHYRIETTAQSAVFSLLRTQEDLTDLLAEAETLGVTAAVGLYQELK